MKKMKTVIIRQEEKADYPGSEAMVRRAFYNRQNPGCVEHYLLHILRESSDYLPAYSFLAEVEGRIVGAIYFSKAFIKTAKGDVPIVTFGPLAVDPLYQGLGIGRQLFEKSVSLLRKSPYPGIAIYGEPNYYPRLGFQRAKLFGITDPEGNVYDPLMVYELRKDGFKGVQGQLFQSPIFEKGNEPKAVAAFDLLFPPYPKLKVQAQWLHETNLGQVEKIEGSLYQIRFWEILIPAKLAESYAARTPQVGDYITFFWKRNTISLIQTLEISE